MQNDAGSTFLKTAHPVKAHEKNINAVRFLPFLQNMRFKIIANSLRINCLSPELDSQAGCYWEHQEV